MKDMDYFRRAIRDAVGSWIVDRLTEDGCVHTQSSIRMVATRDKLLTALDLMEGEDDGKTTP